MSEGLDRHDKADDPMIKSRYCFESEVMGSRGGADCGEGRRGHVSARKMLPGRIARLPGGPVTVLMLMLMEYYGKFIVF
ncbi:hypothetical protein ANO11243_027360 [Dothideomycetidae sp. 11243]|nr:hypothetical protein ANO11243_027360 [fungal sp. No.11243]